MKRRTFFGLLVAAGATLGAGIVAIPAFIAGLAPALQRRHVPAWRAVGPLASSPVGQVQEVAVTLERQRWPRSFRQLAVFVWRPTESAVVVFSRSCTDLGCPLAYDAGSTCFFCPCHGGIFAQDGSRMAGPPNGPMHRYAHRLRDGLLEIDVNSLPPGA